MTEPTLPRTSATIWGATLRSTSLLALAKSINSTPYFTKIRQTAVNPISPLDNDDLLHLDQHRMMRAHDQGTYPARNKAARQSKKETAPPFACCARQKKQTQKYACLLPANAPLHHDASHGDAGRRRREPEAPDDLPPLRLPLLFRQRRRGDDGGRVALRVFPRLEEGNGGLQRPRWDRKRGEDVAGEGEKGSRKTRISSTNDI